MRKEPNRNVYVGHRYVPLILEEWDKKYEYEGLSVVTHKGASYTSKKRVPVGIDILNKEFWSLTGNYNAQVEYYRDDVKKVKQSFDEHKTIVSDDINGFKVDVNQSFDEHKSNVTDDINGFKVDVNQSFDDHKSNVTDDINGFKSDVNSDFNGFKDNVNNNINDFKNDVNTNIKNNFDETIDIINARGISITDDPFNSVGDFSYSTNTGTDNHLAIQKCFDESPEYSTITIPDGIFAISDHVTPKEGQKINFIGKIVLDNKTEEVNIMIRLSNPNIHLINPRLDGRKAHNLVSDGAGRQSILDNYGNGHNAYIQGGLIENCTQSGFSGGRDNLTFINTQFKNLGEHGLYLNGINSGNNSNGLSLYNVKVDGVGAEGIKIRNYDNVNIENPSIDCKNPVNPSRLFMCTNVHNLNISGGNGKGHSHYTFLLSDANGSNQSTNITVENFKSVRADEKGSYGYISGGENVKFKNCIESGSIPSGDDVQYIDCTFKDIPQNMVTNGLLKYINTVFYYQEQSQRFLAVGEKAPLIDNCTFYGNPDIGITYGLKTDVERERLIVKSCKFPDYTGPDAITSTWGTSHVIKDNEIPLSDSNNAIVIRTGVEGTTIISDNYVPLGNINASGDNVIVRDNITTL